jgi:hypothetical protein
VGGAMGVPYQSKGKKMKYEEGEKTKYEEVEKIKRLFKQENQLKKLRRVRVIMLELCTHVVAFAPFLKEVVFVACVNT